MSVRHRLPFPRNLAMLLGADAVGIAFDSEARRDGFLTPSTSKDKRRSSVATEDFELVSVLSWKADERVGQAV